MRLLFLLLLALAFFELYRTPQPVAAPGSIRGTVRLAAPADALTDLPVNRNQETCGRRTPDPSLVLGPERALANAVVSLANVQSVAPASTSPEPAQLDQKACVFLPHVQGVLVGTTLEIANSDPILHNVHAYLGGETLFNVAMPVPGYRIRRKLERPGVVLLKCDAGHTWMSGYIWVSPHPYYAVTDARGNYAITNVPAGSYELLVWHELLGETRVELTVVAGRTSSRDIELSSPDSSR